MLDSVGIGLLVASQIGQWGVVLATLYQVRLMAELVGEAVDRDQEYDRIMSLEEARAHYQTRTPRQDTRR